MGTDAEEILTLMSNDGVNPTYGIYSDIIDAYCAVGEMDHAHKLLEKVECAGFNEPLDLYFSIINGYALLGNLKDAAPLIHHFSAEKTRQFVANYKAETK